MLHIIQDTEKDLHKESEDCDCEPVFKLDEESGEMVWLHQLVAPERLLEGFIEF